MTDNRINAEPVTAHSRNNQFVFYDRDEVIPVAKYMKTTLSAVVGERLHPDTNRIIDFLLRTDDKDYDYKGAFDSDGMYDENIASYWIFRYANEVVELYSDYEHRLFLARNRTLLENGTLVEYDGRPDGHIEALYPTREHNKAMKELERKHKLIEIKNR